MFSFFLFFNFFFSFFLFFSMFSVCPNFSFLLFFHFFIFSSSISSSLLDLGLLELVQHDPAAVHKSDDHQELHRGISGLLHSLHCAYLSLWQKLEVRESAGELNLKHNPLSIGQECRNLSSVITRTSTTLSTICGTGAVPSISMQPWAGGESLRAKPLGVSCDFHQWLPVQSGMEHTHTFRSHHLRHTKHGALRDVVLEKNLGHCDNLLGNNRQHRVEDLEDRPPASPPTAAQEHRESARARTSREWAPRCAAGHFPAQAALPSWQAATLRCLCRTTRITPLPPPLWFSTCSAWPPWSLHCSVSAGVCVLREQCRGVVEGLGKENAHGLPLVLQPRAESVLSPPRGGSTDAFNTSHDVNR